MDFELTGSQPASASWRPTSPASCGFRCRSPVNKIRKTLGESPSKRARVSSPVPPRSPLRAMANGAEMFGYSNLIDLSPNPQSPMQSSSSMGRRPRPQLRRTKPMQQQQVDQFPQLRAALSSLSDNGNSSQSSSGDNGDGQENVTPEESTNEFTFTAKDFENVPPSKAGATEVRQFGANLEAFSPASRLAREKPAKSSPLKRSDGFTGLDATGFGSPAVKRRSVHGAISTPLGAATQIRRQPSLTESDLSVGSDEDSPPRRPGLPSPLAARSAGEMHRNLSIRPSPRPGTNPNRRSAEYERKIQRPATSPINRTSLDSSLQRPNFQRDNENAASTFKIPAFPPSPRQPRHPLAQAQTPSSPNMFDPDEEFLPPPHMRIDLENFNSSRRRPKHPFTKSLPLPMGHLRGRKPPTRDPELDDISFDTPKESKFGPLRDRSFQSTGFFVKKHRDVDDLPPPPEMPDTPCKKSAYELMAESSPDGNDKFLPGRIAQPQFTELEDIASFTPQAVKHSLFNPLRQVQANVSRESSSASGLSEDDFITRQSSSQSVTDDGPDTPTKHLVSKNGKKENSLRRSSFLYRRVSLGPNTFEPPSASEQSTPRADPKDQTFQRPHILNTDLPQTPLDPIPDASGLSISPRSPNTPTFIRHESHGSQNGSITGITPATPTGHHPQTFAPYNPTVLMTPSNHGPAHDLDIELVSRFSHIELLRKGKFSTVYKTHESHFPQISYSSTDKPSFTSSRTTLRAERVFAVKKLGPHRSASDHAKKLKEAYIMEQLGQSDNVISMIRFWESRNHLHLFIQTEYCEEGDLARWLLRHASHRRLDDFRIWKVLIELSHGLKHIHDSGFLHLDIKPENVFIHFDGTLKIGDFGHASEWPAKGVEEEGDRRYMDEDVMHGRYDKPNDVFSLGSVIFEIASNVGLPDNGPRWRQLRSSDWSSLESLTTVSSSSLESEPSGPDGRRSTSSYGIPSDSSGDCMQTDHEGDAGRYNGEIEPPPFMMDATDPASLDQVVHRMMWPASTQRPTIDQVLGFYGCEWVSARKRYGAMIHEGVFGPTDESVGGEYPVFNEDVDMGDAV